MRADRLISMLLLLYANGRMTARELAEELAVTERTVYRDMEALSLSGVPVYTQQGSGGGIFLDENYRVSLTGLSRRDVQALFIAASSQPLHDLGLAHENPLLKLFAALPASQQREVERVRARYYIDTRNWFQQAEATPFFASLHQAVWDDKRIDVTYESVEGGLSSRTLEPYALVSKANVWYFVACRASEPVSAMRTYRLSRVRALRVLEDGFARATDFDVQAYWDEASTRFERNSLEMTPPALVTVRASPFAYSHFAAWYDGRFRELEPPDASGWRTLEVTYSDPLEAAGWLMALAGDVIVLGPESLRQLMRKIAQLMLDSMADDPS
ncbi:MAG: YafY family transcriptional regulator [Pleurocapsa minor GSE-CHR-MK-17-07R]|jgi:predicted DNA-binding transcriptional regulator YafY|nr:YafY family transcriptional regulator [Pleurocapsa minor GSE-CHR-MK 17-07R]